MKIGKVYPEATLIFTDTLSAKVYDLFFTKMDKEGIILRLTFRCNEEPIQVTEDEKLKLNHVKILTSYLRISDMFFSCDKHNLPLHAHSLPVKNETNGTYSFIADEV